MPKGGKLVAIAATVESLEFFSYQATIAVPNGAATMMIINFYDFFPRKKNTVKGVNEDRHHYNITA